MNQRLQQFLSAENITQAQLADALNVARAGISHILAGRNKPGYEFISALMSHYPNLNIEWLMLGKGKMYKQDNSLFDIPSADAPQIFKPAEQADEEHLEDIPDADDLALEEDLPVMTRKIATEDKVLSQRKVSKIIVLFNDGSYQEL